MKFNVGGYIYFFLIHPSTLVYIDKEDKGFIHFDMNLSLLCKVKYCSSNFFIHNSLYSLVYLLFPGK